MMETIELIEKITAELDRQSTIAYNRWLDSINDGPFEKEEEWGRFEAFEDAIRIVEKIYSEGKWTKVS